VKLKAALALLILILAGAGFVCVKYYSYVFAKDVQGELIGVERVNSAESVIATGRDIPTLQLFSFAVAIRDKKGEIHAASSEDRQWAVTVKGQCVEARFYPYAPWQLDKAGTYFGARLNRIFDCTALKGAPGAAQN